MIANRIRVEVYKKLPDATYDSTAIVLSEVMGNPEWKKGSKKVKDIFRFNINNAKNRLIDTFFDGDGSTVNFTLPFAPNSQFLDDEAFKVFIKESGVWVQKQYSTHYSVSSTTLTFVTAPALDYSNIRVQFPKIHNDDLIKIYRWRGGAWGTLSAGEQNTALSEGMVGIVERPIYSWDKDGRTMTVRGKSLMEVIFKGMVINTNVSTNNKAHLILIDTIKQLNARNPSDKKLHGESITEWQTDIGNDVTTKTIQYSTDYVHAIDIWEKMSTHEFTGDGEYDFWLDYSPTDDRFEPKWQKKNPDVSSGDVDQGSYGSELEAEKSTDEVITSVIYNVGEDCEGNGQEYLFYDYTAQSSLFAKEEYLTDTYPVTEILLNEEFKADTSKWNFQTDDSGIKIRQGRYPKDASIGTYGAMQFKTRDDNGDPTGSDYNVTSQEDFNKAIRTEAYWIGWKIAKEFVTLHRNPRDKADVTMRASSTFTMSQLWNLSIRNIALFSKALRIKEIDSYLDEDVVKFEEDEVQIIE